MKPYGGRAVSDEKDTTKKASHGNSYGYYQFIQMNNIHPHFFKEQYKKYRMI